MGLPRLFAAILIVSAGLSAQVAVTTQHNDLSRTGQNLQEVTLNTSNVNQETFGKLFSLPVDGQIYAQPLYVPSVLIPGEGVHNVVYVATENNTVYAFDADVPGLNPLWNVNLGPALLSTVIDVTRNIQPEIGITSTPTIDLSSNTIYVVAEIYVNSQASFQLHALDITTGAEKFNGPVTIQGSAPGHSSDSVGGSLAFSPIEHWQRPGLLEWNGVVYVGFGSHEDAPPYHGWLFGYNATTLAQTAIYCTTPNGSLGGVWQGGVGLALDPSTGYLYMESGNGTMDANTGNGDYGDSILKLDTSSKLAVLDYFSPSNQATLSADDADLGASGPLLIPGTTLGLGGGKDGTMYLFNRNDLGQYNSVDQVVQEWQATYSIVQTGDGGFFGGFAYYNSQLYVWGRRDNLKEYTFNGSTFNTTPTEGTTTISDGYSNEPAMSISANGTTAGSAILWANYSTNGDNPNGGPSPGILVALNANSITQELWDSNQNQTRDYAGTWAKWCPPTIVNGKVYLATFDSLLNVYGLLTPPYSGSLLGNGNSSEAAVNLTTEGISDWEHWGDGSLNRKTGVTPLLSTYTAVGSGSVSAYGNDPRPVSWTDGTPTTSSSNDTNGVSIQGVGQGFSITAPADTAARTLVLHVGGWNSGGTLTAHLSDGSAPNFTDVTALASGQYDRNYTLTYHAGNAAQTLTVTWAMTSGTGNVSLSAAVLEAAVVVASGGTPQIEPVNTAFTTPLQATVTDGGGNPVSGVAVVFTAPASGASGTFAGGSTSASIQTGSNGIAVAPTFTANSQAGAYAVTASASGIGGVAMFSLTNTAATTGGTLSGFGTSSTSLVNLTSEGSADWEHWGDANLNRKSGVTALLGPYMVVGSGGGAIAYNDDPRPLSWTDGTPTASSSNNTDGLYEPGVGQGFSFPAPADTTTRTLIVHVGGWDSGGTLTAQLSDGSAANFTDVTTAVSGQYDRNYTLTYSAAHAGAILTVNWVMNSGTGNVTLNAAALSVSGSSLGASGGTPQSAAEGTAFTTPLQATLTNGGNPVSGVTVMFTAPSSGASGTFTGGSTIASVMTGSNGIASAAFTANSKLGSYTVTASASGVTGTASYSLTNTVGAAATVTASGGNSQSATVSTAFAAPLQATVTDNGGNPVSGVTVLFKAPSSGASGTFTGGSTTASVATGSNGVASAAFTANSAAGSYSVTATVTGLTPASFSLTNTPVVTSGTLSGSGTSSQSLVNLTSEGSTDWEHWGDASLNRKAGVPAQLSTYTMVQGGSASTYNNDLRPISWTDGTPTASSSNNANGVYVWSVGHGFSIQAPADTTTRTLIVHVGGWDSGGTLTAQLSDGSAANFTDVTTTVSGQYDRNYTLTYSAANAGKTLTVTWVMSSGTGNVTLNAAALSVSGSSLAASGGTPQSTMEGTAFTTALQATVTSGGNPVSGVTVVFTAPSSGASGTFTGGSTTASVTTGGNGVASAAFTANSTAGSYSVTATVTGLTPASFSLTNTPVVTSGTLSGSGTSSQSLVNLTSEGTADWAFWAGGDRKAEVTAQLSPSTVVGGGGALPYSNDLRPVSWTDGTPLVSSASNTSGLFIPNVGHGFSFTAPAGTTTHTLVVHVGGWNSGGTLTAKLSDGSAASFTDVTANVSGQYDRNYTLTYAARSPGQTLTVTWVMSSGTGNVTLNAAALQ